MTSKVALAFAAAKLTFSDQLVVVNRLATSSSKRIKIFWVNSSVVSARRSAKS